MEWYYAKHGKQEGPVELAVLQSKVQSGEIAPTDLVWRDGMPEWKPAGEVAELAAAPQAAVPQQTPVGPVTQTPVQGTTAGPTARSQQQPVTAPVAHTHIQNYLVPAILVTIFCCWPFGIPAIVFAAKVDGMVSRGDIAGAQHASDQAKMWCWVSVGGWVAFVALYVVFFMVVGLGGDVKKRLLLAGLLVLAGVVGLVVLYRSDPGQGSILPPCVFHEVTGFHCAGCGITRATHALLHLRFAEAFGQNPLLVLALPLVIAAVAIEVRAWIVGAGYRGPRVRLPRWAYGLLLLTIVAYWVLRNVPVWPFELLAPH